LTEKESLSKEVRFSHWMNRIEISSEVVSKCWRDVSNNMNVSEIDSSGMSLRVLSFSAQVRSSINAE
jgi:hypothetical protein